VELLRVEIGEAITDVDHYITRLNWKETRVEANNVRILCVCVCVCVCVCTVELSYLSQLVWCSFALSCSTTYKQPTHRSTVEKEVISGLCECSRIDVGTTIR